MGGTSQLFSANRLGYIYNFALWQAEYTRNTRAAMALGSLCIITSIVYTVDFIYVMIRSLSSSLRI